MKNTIAIITLGAALLLASGTFVEAQRNFQRNNNGAYDPTANFQRNPRGVASYAGGTDPRLATNIGVEIISRNNIFDPTRIWREPLVPRAYVPPPQNFTLTGVMTYGANDVGYGFFNGNAATPSRGYMAADTINGFKISEITNNTVKVVDTNNQEYILRVGAGFSRRSPTNEWRFLSVPEPTMSTSTSISPGSDSDSGLSGAQADAYKRLRARRAAEEGPALGGDAGAPDAGSPPPPPDGSAPPAPPAPPDGAQPPPPPAPPAPPAN